MDVMQAGANAAVAVVSACDQCGYQPGMIFLITGSGAVLAVERDIEQGAKPLLQRHRSAHQFFGAGVMVADRQRNRLTLALE
jgi:hypothetical protein